MSSTCYGGEEGKIKRNLETNRVYSFLLSPLRGFCSHFNAPITLISAEHSMGQNPPSDAKSGSHGQDTLVFHEAPGSNNMSGEIATARFQATIPLLFP